MTEGAREAWLESDFNTPAPAGTPQVWPERVPFVTQKQKIREAVRSPLAAVRLVLRLMNPRHWPGTFTRYLQYR